MTEDERLALLRIKLDRANQHFVDLQSAAIAFFDGKPYEIASKHDPHSRKLIYYMIRVDPVPLKISAIAGDTIQNLRSVLDHLARQLFLVAGIGNPETEFNFPIFNKASDYETRMKGIAKTLRRDAIEALRSIEAYKGGKGHDIWVLNRLNNIDKHRLLVAVGSSMRSVDIGALMRIELQRMMSRRGETFELPEIPVFLRPADNMCPLKVGDELFIDAPDAEHNDKMQFRFDIAFNEPGVVEGKSVIETLKDLVNLIGNIVVAFKPCLR